MVGIYIIKMLQAILQLYSLILLLRVLVSWLRLDPYHPAVRLLYSLTEPLLEPIRSVLPPTGMVDFSPMVAFILLVALQQVLSILAGG